MFFQFWNINIGIRALGEGAGELERQGHWQLLSHVPWDPKLTKSSPTGIPLWQKQSPTGDWLALLRGSLATLGFLQSISLGVISPPEGHSPPNPTQKQILATTPVSLATMLSYLRTLTQGLVHP